MTPYQPQSKPQLCGKYIRRFTAHMLRIVSSSNNLKASLANSMGSSQNKYNYIKLQQLKEQKKIHDHKGLWIMSYRVSKYMLKQIWKDVKCDWKIHKTISKISPSQRTFSEKSQLYRIRIDMVKFVPAFIIFNFPIGVEFFIYMYLFPGLIPTWMLVDTVNNQMKTEKLQNQIEAWNFYKELYQSKGSILRPEKASVAKNILREIIHREFQTLEDLRNMSEICYGSYIDGSEYLGKLFRVKRISCGLGFPIVSKVILWLNLYREIAFDYDLQPWYEEKINAQQQFSKEGANNQNNSKKPYQQLQFREKLEMKLLHSVQILEQLKSSGK